MNDIQAETIHGESIAFRLSNRKETGVPYIPGTLYIRKLAELAQQNGGRVLFTRSYGANRQLEKTINQIVICERTTPIALYGTITKIGIGYDQSWNPDNPYQAPVPWNMRPTRKWYALDNVRLFRINPDEYYATAEGHDVTMSDIYGKSGPLVFPIRPKKEEA